MTPEKPASDAPSWPETTVTLLHPVTGPDGEQIASLTFREPDVEALEKIEDIDAKEGEKIKVRHLRVIAAALSRQPDDVIRKINARDFGKVSEALVPFLEYAVTRAPSSGS